jgi:hypothetical protein
MTLSSGALRLKAEDQDDLAVLSAALQDSLFRVKDAVFEAKARRFTLIVDRFKWEVAEEPGPYQRIKAGLSFEGVRHVRSQNVRRDTPEAKAWLLAVEFTPDPEPPSGIMRLVLAGGGAIQLEVECVDVALVDTGAPWTTPRKPNHSEQGGAP